jgi:restriction endonuclease S subunit
MTRGQGAHLYAEDLKDLCVPVPPLEIQKTIVDEMNRRRSKAKQLFTDAERIITAAKNDVERTILG